MFDVWQTSSPIKLPEYAIETTTRSKIKDVLKKNKLNIKKVFNGQTLFYFLNDYFKGIVSKYSKYYFFKKLYFLCDRYFFSKIEILNVRSQSIIFVVTKTYDN